VSHSRPEQVVVVVGTGTEVGKSWVSAALLAACRAKGIAVAARKPAQSFVAGEGPTDAEVLGSASGEDPQVVCPPHRWYEMPLAPPMAAVELHRPPFTVDHLVREIAWPKKRPGLGLVETAGGVASPQASDGDATDVIRILDPDWVLLVADAGLGVINAVRLSILALRSADPPRSRRVLVVLNRFDSDSVLHTRNLEWLSSVDGLDVVTSPASDPFSCGRILLRRIVTAGS
jgi:dethiobiotin synthetase